MLKTMKIKRLTTNDISLARKVFSTMCEVFETPAEPLSDGYLNGLLSRADFWAMAAISDGEAVGGLTAHTLPMTRSESAEIFIYDLAVRVDRQRQGIGRQLIEALRTVASEAGIHELFVPADNEDTHALDFYRAVGGAAAPVTIFSFSRSEQA
jgi:aminoglycoside 3-N-acetyltransferase I